MFSADNNHVTELKGPVRQLQMDLVVLGFNQLLIPVSRTFSTGF